MTAELDEIVDRVRQSCAEYSGEKGEAYWSGYAAGLLRALEIVEEQP